MLTSEDLSQVLIACAQSLATLTLTLTAHKTEWAKRLRSPQVGDLVVETTAHRSPALHRVGRLTAVADEPCYTADQWNEGKEGRPMPTAVLFTIELLNGDMMRWTDCVFVSLPREVCPMDLLQGIALKPL